MSLSVKTAKAKARAKMGAKGHGKAERVRVVRASTFMGRDLAGCHRSSRESGIVQRNGRHGHSNNNQPPTRTNTLTNHNNNNKRSTKHRDHRGQEELVSQGEQSGLG